ncbi:hypothetical protein N9C44_00920 [bacterium]|jgi:DNA polymerase III alpha subunit|nr:hypothetical protein [bacterium]|tara:strand:- start:2750 stop:3223 length:474 start_codon:yes stop_codon:yes gene_type:complete
MENYLANEQTGIELLYRGNEITDVAFDDVEKFNKFAKDLELLPISDVSSISKELNIPQHYKELDVTKYIHNKFLSSSRSENSADEIARLETELEMFKDRGLFPVLQLMIYIVDTMRKHNLVWGVGRGSSVSSYLLYILGVHKVNSHKYRLDITEFLK